MSKIYLAVRLPAKELFLLPLLSWIAVSAVVGRQQGGFRFAGDDQWGDEQGNHKNASTKKTGLASIALPSSGWRQEAFFCSFFQKRESGE